MTARRRIGWSLLGAAALVLPLVVYPVLGADILAWALFAAAFDLLLGHTGLLSFGHAAYFGCGAYVAALLATRLQAPFPLNALAGGVAAGILSLPLMGLSIRRKGIYFAMITLAFAQMVYYIANQWRGVTGGENGITGVPRGHAFGVSLVSSTVFYYATLVLVTLALLLCWRIVRSPFGRILVAIRENEARAQSLGYAVGRYKLIAAMLSGALAGLAGGIWVINHGFVGLDAVHWSTSGTVVIMTLLGGMGTRLGPVVGAALVIALRDAISAWTDAWGVVTGIIFIAVILAFRRGIVGTLEGALGRRAAPAPAVPAPERPLGTIR